MKARAASDPSLRRRRVCGGHCGARGQSAKVFATFLHKTAAAAASLDAGERAGAWRGQQQPSLETRGADRPRCRPTGTDRDRPTWYVTTKVEKGSYSNEAAEDEAEAESFSLLCMSSVLCQLQHPLTLNRLTPPSFHLSQATHSSSIHVKASCMPAVCLVDGASN